MKQLMTEKQVYEETLHALRRLRVKELMSLGQLHTFPNEGERVCAVGALVVHLQHSMATDSLYSAAADVYHHCLSLPSGTTVPHIIEAENDRYLHALNHQIARKKRYTHMVKWLKEQIRSAE